MQSQQTIPLRRNFLHFGYFYCKNLCNLRGTGFVSLSKAKNLAADGMLMRSSEACSKLQFNKLQKLPLVFCMLPML